ncbi:DUF58 domain-containing protein [Segniliparus rugosus]|uniref:DUF58 domain-containing protein n=1 Tax=Segniliparus rugosus (strain ATCC BAA-974 / DSM 45345 / CCUG 50838 / CIP 108380 / JCM 13579 / CDC 945) TaxID=679197 RepID=E5XQ48_SEGRC|nr:DUF58 domain-containing protein [Segniliparus rugosus]EFV13521.1 hypothetical protein HMPREF9336_01620 [Segniliparus rugosus ATCC BAA-974]
MGALLQRVRAQVLAGQKLVGPTGKARALLDGGHLSLFHGRSQEFDDLRPYVPGDDVRDIDWKATARSAPPQAGGPPNLLVKRFVSLRQHKVLLVVDVSRSMSALAPSGETKRDVAVNAMGMMGLVSIAKGDEISLVYGDARGSARMPPGRGETHVERILARVAGHDLDHAARDSLAVQLAYVERNFRKRYVVFLVSGEPSVGERCPAQDGLAEQLRRVAAGHDLYWIIVRDAPILSDPAAPLPGGWGSSVGYDVETGKVLLREEALGRKVLAAYRQAEERREAALADFLAACGVRAARVEGTWQLRKEVTTLLRRSGHGG